MIGPTRFILGLVAILALLAACASPAADDTSVPPLPPADTPTVAVTAEGPTPDIGPAGTPGIIPGTPPALEPVGPSDIPTPDAIGGAPSDVVQAMIDDLSQRTGFERADIQVLGSESVVWNDGSLGCPQPGQMYTQALVDGYRVILGHTGQTFDYRASGRGFFILCETPAPLPTGLPRSDAGPPAK